MHGVGDRATVQCQLPLGAGEDSEPEPDVAIIPNADYSREHPTRALFVAEVSDSSLPKDRLLKAVLYARAGVPEYWIINVPDRVVEVHRGPDAGGYRAVTIHRASEVIRPAAFPDLTIDIAVLFPQAG
jgi:Uma2 family endonuclease